MAEVQEDNFSKQRERSLGQAYD